MKKSLCCLLLLVVVTIPTLGMRIADLGPGKDTFDVIVNLTALLLPAVQATAVRPDPTNGVVIEVDTVGPMTVVRGQPQRGRGGTATVQTEIVSMDLSGFHPVLGEIHVRQDPNRPSKGRILLRKEGNQFVVDSFFDVFFDVFFHVVVNGQKQRIRAQNMPAASGQARVSSWPAFETDFVHTPPKDGPVMLVVLDDNGNAVRKFAQIRSARVIPTVGAHARIKRELILVEQKLHRVLFLLRRLLGTDEVPVGLLPDSP